MRAGAVACQNLYDVVCWRFLHRMQSAVITCVLQMRMSGLDAQLKDLVELVRVTDQHLQCAHACACVHTFMRASAYIQNGLWHLADLH
jgi:hypothetical protein